MYSLAIKKKRHFIPSGYLPEKDSAASFGWDWAVMTGIRKGPWPKSDFDPYTGARLLKPIKVVPLGIDSRFFFEFFTFFFKVSFFDICSIFLRKFDLFFLLLSNFFKVPFFNIFCLNKTYLYLDNLKTSEFLSTSLASLSCFKILEIQKLGLEFGLFTADFFLTYRVKKVLPIYRKSFSWFSYKLFGFLSVNMDFLFCSKYKEYIGDNVYFFPKLRTALMFNYHWDFVYMHSYYIKLRRRFTVFLFENYLLNLYYARYILFFSLVVDNNLLVVYKGDLTFISLVRNKVLLFLFNVVRRVRYEGLTSFLYSFFIFELILFCFYIVSRMPRTFFFTKLRHSYFFSFAFVIFIIPRFYNFFLTKFWHFFEWRFFILSFNSIGFFNSSFFSSFFVSQKKRSDLFADKILSAVPLVIDTSLFDDSYELAEAEFTHCLVKESMPARRTKLLMKEFNENRIIIDEDVFLDNFFLTEGISSYANSIFSASLCSFFFWNVCNLGVLNNFFYASLDFFLIFTKIFIDDFFLNRFFSSIFFLRKAVNIYYKHSSQRIIDGLKVINFGFFFNTRDVFFKLLVVSDPLALYVFFSLNRVFVSKLIRFFFRVSFLKFRSFYILPNFPPYVADVYSPLPFCNHFFID